MDWYLWSSIAGQIYLSNFTVPRRFGKGFIRPAGLQSHPDSSVRRISAFFPISLARCKLRRPGDRCSPALHDHRRLPAGRLQPLSARIEFWVRGCLAHRPCALGRSPAFHPRTGGRHRNRPAPRVERSPDVVPESRISAPIRFDIA